jgi:hypothetical protein
MCDLYRALGQGELAREAFQTALAIAERLARAEPDRADYQRDLIVSLVRAGSFDDSASYSHLESAWRILKQMDNAGRLEISDRPMIAGLRKLLTDRGLATD